MGQRHFSPPPMPFPRDGRIQAKTACANHGCAPRPGPPAHTPSPARHGQTLQGNFPAGAPRLPGTAVLQARPGAPVPGNGEALALPASFRLPAGGQPLPDGLRRQMEDFFRADFSDVRVHVGREAPALGATAFTVGSNIHFAPGRYQPQTASGIQLLGHELCHVVQQRAGRVRNPFGAGVAVVRNAVLEAEADRLGRDAAVTIQRSALAPNRTTMVRHDGGGARPRHSFSIGGAVQRMEVADPAAAARIRYPDADSLCSMDALADLQDRFGETSQATLALFKAGGRYYAVEQETNTRMMNFLRSIGVTYLPQGRLGGFHAEMRFVRWAKQNAIDLNSAEVWVSKPICPKCGDVLTRRYTVTTHVAVETGPGSDSWIDPEGSRSAEAVMKAALDVVSRGNYHGRQSETQRLLAGSAVFLGEAQSSYMAPSKGVTTRGRAKTARAQADSEKSETDDRIKGILGPSKKIKKHRK